jgi:hypothetical protein
MRLVFRQPKRADDTTGNRGTGTGGKFSGIPEPSRCPRTGQKIKRGSDSIAESEPFLVSMEPSAKISQIVVREKPAVIVRFEPVVQMNLVEV